MGKQSLLAPADVRVGPYRHTQKEKDERLVGLRCELGDKALDLSVRCDGLARWPANIDSLAVGGSLFALE